MTEFCLANVKNNVRNAEHDMMESMDSLKRLRAVESPDEENLVGAKNGGESFVWLVLCARDRQRTDTLL